MDSKHLSGFELARKLLTENDNDASSLLKKTNYQETDWLEFKATAFLDPNTAKPGETQDDLSWNILKAVIAFANTIGGCILIGIDDKGKQYIPLHLPQASGENTTSLDDFKRKVMDTILSAKKFKIHSQNDKNPNRTVIEVEDDDIKNLVRFEDAWIERHDQRMLALLVEPKSMDDTGGYIFVKKSLSNAPPQSILPVRAKGSIGETLLLEGKEITTYKRSWKLDYQSAKSNVPLPNVNFVGRQEDIKALYALHQQNGLQILIIHGPAGTGKTELVRYYAKKYSEEYPAGCLMLAASGCKTIP